MRAVVTGATSMIGVALINECIKNGDKVLAIVHKGTSRMKRLPQSELLQVEYASLDTLNEVSGDGKEYNVFYHFAWAHTKKQERDDAVLQETNIKTTLDAVELAHKLGCKKFVGAGSQAEYGPVAGVINEETTCNPAIAYGMAKLSANYLSKKLCETYGMTQVWGRIFSVYGTNDNEDTMIDYALKCFGRDEVAKFSSGTQCWNYLFEEDAGKIFYQLGVSTESAGVYCVANPKSRKLKDYIQEMAEVCGKPELVSFSEGSASYGLEVDPQKLNRLMGNTEYISFADGIIRTIECKKKE